MLKRIISRLDIKNNTLVKGVHLEGLRVLGSPKHFMNTYYNDGIDEIYYQDIVASLYKRNTMTDILAYSVENIFIPISVGGGINSLNYLSSLIIGFSQCLALIPGVSRSGSIVTAMRYFGFQRKFAVYYSNLLSIPAILSATGYLLITNL